RFDLYAALGVDPSADLVAIEQAYLDLIDAQSGNTGASTERRIFRARVAREWLTDPELRGRYDTSRARAASRSAAKAAGGGGWGALIVAGLVAFCLVYSALGSTGVAVRETPTPAPTAAPPTATPLPPTPEPTVLPTVEPSVEPTAPGPTGLPAEFAQGAFDTL